jgi:hypothetical protein
MDSRQKKLAAVGVVGAGLVIGGLIAIFSRKGGGGPPPPPPNKGNLFGSAVSADTRQRLSGVAATLWDSAFTIQMAQRMTDSQGYYEFIAATPGMYGLTFEKSGYNTLKTTVDIHTGQNEYLAVLTTVAVGPPCDLPAEWQWLVDSLMDTMGLTYDAALAEACKRYSEYLDLAGQVHFTTLQMPASISEGQLVTSTCYFSLPYSTNTLWHLYLNLNRGGRFGDWTWPPFYDIQLAGQPLWEGVHPLVQNGLYQISDSKTLQFESPLKVAPTPQGVWDVLAYLTSFTIYPGGEFGYPSYDVWQGIKVGEVTVV